MAQLPGRELPQLGTRVTQMGAPSGLHIQGAGDYGGESSPAESSAPLLGVGSAL